MSSMTVSKRTSKAVVGTIGSYEVKVRDYGYKRRAPVSVTVSGTTLGEATNPFGEPCYFCKFDDAMNLEAGLQIAYAIVAGQQAKMAVAA